MGESDVTSSETNVPETFESRHFTRKNGQVKVAFLSGESVCRIDFKKKLVE